MPSGILFRKWAWLQIFLQLQEATDIFMLLPTAVARAENGSAPDEGISRDLVPVEAGRQAEQLRAGSITRSILLQSPSFHSVL